MRIERRSRVALAAAAFVLATAVAFAQERPGSLGCELDIVGDGVFWNPTLTSVTITKVRLDSPASRAGIVPGDQIIEADGRTVVGAKARDLEPLLKRQVGDSVQLRLRRATGELYSATVVAGERVEQP